MRRLTIHSLSALVLVALASLALVQLASARSKVTFVFKNIGHIAHDFKINRKVTRLLQPGKSAKLVVTFKKKGKYR